jgi:hypothetical protein
MLKIQMSKQKDGAVVLGCTRADASITWQRQTKHAAFFVLHDLTHYAVETTLGCRNGFFGLVSAGWDLEDTTGKGARGPLPAETVEVEKIVGLFDSERGSGVPWTVEEFNGFSPLPLTQEQIQGVRTLRGSLFQQWFALPSGQTLELQF